MVMVVESLMKPAPRARSDCRIDPERRLRDLAERVSGVTDKTGPEGLCRSVVVTYVDWEEGIFLVGKVAEQSLDPGHGRRFGIEQINR
jgi:hypothetical protein